MAKKKVIDRLKQREKQKENARKWRQANPERVREYARKRAELVRLGKKALEAAEKAKQRKKAREERVYTAIVVAEW